MRAAPFHGQKLVTWKFGHIGLLNAWKEEEIFCEKCFSAHFSDFCGVFFFLFISLFFFLSSFPLPFFFSSNSLPLWFHLNTAKRGRII